MVQTSLKRQTLLPKESLVKAASAISTSGMFIIGCWGQHRLHSANHNILITMCCVVCSRDIWHAICTLPLCGLVHKLVTKVQNARR